MPTTCFIDEYEQHDYISCLHGNGMDICMLKNILRWLGGCSHGKLTGNTSSVLCLLKLGHHLAEKPLWKGTIGSIVLDRVLSSQAVIITDCSSSVAMATAHCLRRLVNSICAGNGHLIPVILCEE